MPGHYSKLLKSLQSADILGVHQEAVETASAAVCAEATSGQTRSIAAISASPELANHGSRVSEGTANLVPAIQRIDSIKYHAPDFKDAKELKAAFEEADKEVKTKGAAAIDGQADVILALAKMQAILSQRGKEKMRREAGINQSWTTYYRWFQKEFDFDLTLRAVQYKIAELAGKRRHRKCIECHKTDGHATSCSKYKEPPPPHLTQLEAKLLDATSLAHEVVKAVKQGGDVNKMIADFEKNAPTSEKLVEYAERPVKPSLGDPAPQPSKRSGNELDYRGMLVDLLDQVEKLGPRLPSELHTKCKQYRSTIGLPPNVVSGPPSLRIVSLTLKQAKELVAKLHRHHKPPLGHKFSIGVENNEILVGVAMCSRPACPQIAKEDHTLEVSRVATDGTKNACSMLYSACARAAQAMGYDKIQTYILVTEPGTTLKASGWNLDKELCGDNRGTRFHKNRKDGLQRQEAGHEAVRKQRWAKDLRVSK